MIFKHTLKLRKAKRFVYIPRFKKEKEDKGIRFRRMFEKSEFSTFDKSNHWNEYRTLARKRSNGGINTRILIIIFILSLIAYFVLDLDLSMF